MQLTKYSEQRQWEALKAVNEKLRLGREAQESYYMAEALERAELWQAWREEQQWIADEINH